MNAIDVGATTEFVDGVLRIVEIERMEIGILLWRGEWFAVRNVCPHLGAPVCAGPIQSYLSEAKAWSGDLQVDPKRPVIMCPWHRWEFDLRTGQGISGREKVRVYPVNIAEGRVMVELRSRRAA